MFAFHTSRSNARSLSAEFPIGDPFGHGQKNDVGSIIGAVAGPLISGVMGSNAASNASDAQSQASAQSLALQREMWQRQLADQQPWHDAGVNALGKMQNYAAPGQFNFDANAFAANKDPGYAFRMSEGLKALDASAASRGGLLSGATLKGAQRYGQDMASQEYQNAYGRALTGYNANENAANTGYNRLAGLAGIGQTANSQIGAANANYANNATNLITGNANAQGAAGIAGANAWSNAIGQGMSSYQNNNLINMLRNNGSGSNWGTGYQNTVTGTPDQGVWG